MPKQPFGHGASTNVPGADEQNGLHASDNRTREKLGLAQAIVNGEFRSGQG
jgi:hypothetical protein